MNWQQGMRIINVDRSEIRLKLRLLIPSLLVAAIGKIIPVILNCV
ncbi:hypothetical protein [Microcoleus sp. Pol12B5]